jgi:manganese transport protein
MQGFTNWRIPIVVRRLVTMLPAFGVVAAGFDATRSLVISQVVLSLVLPVPMVALVVLSRSRGVMGAMRTGSRMFALAVAATCATLALNMLLLAQIMVS